MTKFSLLFIKNIMCEGIISRIPASLLKETQNGLLMKLRRFEASM
jgi:hypothetical protein